MTRLNGDSNMTGGGRAIHREQATDGPRDESPPTWIKADDRTSPARRRMGTSPPARRLPWSERLKLRQDYRGRLPPWLSRYTGYRQPGTSPPYGPTAAFSWLAGLPLKVEVALCATIGSFISILLVESISATSTDFRNLFHSPLIIASFGATAVLIYGVIESPLAQPRAVIGGQVISAILGVALTRLFALDKSYIPALDNEAFHYGTFINGALSMSVALLAMFLTKTIHPPGGATALIAATSIEAARMSWSYIAFVLASTLLMVGWALIINNIGRRRYPVYWWSPERTFVVDEAPAVREDEEIALGTGGDNELRRAEDGGRTAEALAEERLEGQGGNPDQLHRALSRASRDSATYDRGRKNSVKQ